MKLKQILQENENPCWKGYRQLGMKKKNGKEVPNCVPESVQESYNGTSNDFARDIILALDNIGISPKAIKKISKKGRGFEVRMSSYMKNKDTWDKLGKEIGVNLVDFKPGNINIGLYESQSSLEETMLVRVGDLAQKILPKDAFQVKMNSFQDADKAKERQSSMLRDLSSFLNKFYKNYNLNVRVQ